MGDWFCARAAVRGMIHVRADWTSILQRQSPGHRPYAIMPVKSRAGQQQLMA